MSCRTHPCPPTVDHSFSFSGQTSPPSDSGIRGESQSRVTSFPRCVQLRYGYRHKAKNVGTEYKQSGCISAHPLEGPSNHPSYFRFHHIGSKSIPSVQDLQGSNLFCHRDYCRIPLLLFSGCTAHGPASVCRAVRGIFAVYGIAISSMSATVLSVGSMTLLILPLGVKVRAVYPCAM